MARVSQLDAAQLDDELLTLFATGVADSLALLKVLVRWIPVATDAEATLLVQLVAYCLSLLASGSSYGLSLQNLRYRQSFLHRRSLVWLYPLLSFGAPYAWTRLTVWLTRNRWGAEPENAWRKRCWTALFRFEKGANALRLINLLLFLHNGKYRSLVDRLLRLRLAPINGYAARDVSLEFLHRQLLWHSFTEFLLFFVPLLSTQSAQRLFRKYLMPSAKLLDYTTLPSSVCAICFSSCPQYASSPQDALQDKDLLDRYRIVTPYRANCGCIYCYYCLQSQLNDSAGEIQCGRCGQTITSCHRVEEKL